MNSSFSPADIVLDRGHFQRTTSLDPLSFQDSSGHRIRIPPYSKLAPFTKIKSYGVYQVFARRLFTTGSKSDDQIDELARFCIRITRNHQPVYYQQYRSDQTGLTAAMQTAVAWIERDRLTTKLLYITSWQLTAIWLFLAGIAWFLFPIIGWLSYFPFFVSLPAAWYSASNFRPRKSRSSSLAGLSWTRNDFCRGWLITGDTGAGKTFAINLLLHSVFKNEPNWGGLCCDEKGIYHETLVKMARKYGRSQDLLLLQTRPDQDSEDWVPPATFNLLSDSSIPCSTYATVIVDTASALSSGHEDKGFFKTQAHSHIGRGIQLFRLLGLVPTMHHLLELLQYQSTLKAMLQYLESLKNEGNPDVKECYEHFQNGYLRQPPEQLGGVISTIYNYLNYFTNPDIIEVFGTETNTFDFSTLDDGAIICLSLPQKYQTERRYITTILKLLFYTHALRRFDPRSPGKRQLADDNLLICWQDEAQRFITQSDGNVDIMRQAQVTTVMATQSKSSFLPALGNSDKANVTILNLRNRIIFKAADRACAESSADFIGKRPYWKKSYTKGKGGLSTSRTKEEEYLVKPYELMALPKFTAIVKHCEKGYRKRHLHPLDPEGNIPNWYPLWKRILW